VVSPFSATFALPLDIESPTSGAIGAAQAAGEPLIFFGYVGWSVLYNALLLGLVVWLFQSRWRIGE
ncbi:MAG: hypothetical protein AAF596_05300, partial [Planctomycetota bacterium]